MQVVETVAQVVAACREARRPLGLVPTMGALHEGHLSLVRRARLENATVAASVFVNPAQFGPREDLAAYPRDLQRDLDLLRAEGTDLVFAPPLEEVYPPGFDTYVEPGEVAINLEGAHRPGHFRGVATVVTKLFAILRPDRAYFGQKDGQQVAVVRRLNADLDLGVEVVVCPTVRESDGLAMSSRNVYLNPEERRAATVLYRALCRARDLYQQGERDAARLRRAMEEVLRQEPLARTDYVSIADPDTIQELERVEGPAMASLAVRIGRTRLIDNFLLGRDLS
ncbi:MAG: pantoate--beta-alanine ligase [Chloroflexi bacterium]|nr:pantoate--beta-alanine ligase [Chloroflexota bacterium]